MFKKTILFLTGTRADFGKLKPLIQAVKNSSEYECLIFVTGMHLLAKYGSTVHEIERSGLGNYFTYMNQVYGDDMEIVLANTISGLSRYLHENKVDLIVLHGDRVESLAGATVGALRNILVAHVEGGEISGTIDELMRHAISKLSHFHFVANETAQKRLRQLGEDEKTIFNIGSPDIDVMLSNDLPHIDLAKERYKIDYPEYAVAILHPVTTDDRCVQTRNASIFVDTLIESGLNYIVIYPNNDLGSDAIFSAYDSLAGNASFRIFPSLRFEYFLTLLKHSDFIIGNSSAGIHEAPIYGVPTINLGTRQQNRFSYSSIFDVEFEKSAILDQISKIRPRGSYQPTYYYGDGGSANKFMEVLKTIWELPKQKQFKDLDHNNV